MRHRRGQGAARPRARGEPAEDAVVESLSDGDTFSPKEVVHAHPGALPRVRAVRDGHPGHAGPVDRLGHRRPRVRGGGRAAAGHQLRRAARPPARHRRARLRRHRGRLRGRLDAGRGPPGGALAHGHDAPLAGARLRRHRAGGGGLRPSRGAGRPAHRARGHLQGRGRGVAARGARPGRPALRRPPRHARGARPGDCRPRQRGPRATRPGGLRATSRSSSRAA